jgi:hypothetical protein
LSSVERLDAMTTQRDIPGSIAKWLFRIGIIWAVILVPFTIVAFLSVFGRGLRFWQLGFYFLIGFAVWGGWWWRSRQRRSLRAVAAFWFFSAAFNSGFIVYLIATESQWTKILAFDESAFYLWWWIAATVASLVALAFEFALQRDETRPA